MAQLSNITTAATALSCAPNGTTWTNGQWSMSKLKTPGGFKGSVYLASDGKKKWYLNAANAATFMNQRQIKQANNPFYSIVPKATTPAKQKNPSPVKGTKAKPKPKVEKPTEEEISKQFDDSDILLAKTVQSEFDQANFDGLVQDWRVRLALAPGANYLYMGKNPGILQPLIATKGVVFPYTPNITVNYQANYDGIDLTHSNYKVFQYKNSSVDQVTITCEFTAQDVFEARYLLAVIHFFRTMTKMFYGQDVYPIRGTPPPLCYMFGMGGYQFAAHPLAINSFNYTLPNDVDYIATTAPEPPAAPEAPIDPEIEAAVAAVDAASLAEFMGPEAYARLGTEIAPGGIVPPAKFNTRPRDITTWVPTKIQLSIGCVPIMSRNQVSNYFSLEDYASGYLIKGTTRPGGGMW